MIRPLSLAKQLARFRHEDLGGSSALALSLIMGAFILGGLSLDLAYAYKTRNELQIAALEQQLRRAARRAARPELPGQQHVGVDRRIPPVGQAIAGGEIIGVRRAAEPRRPLFPAHRDKRRRLARGIDDRQHAARLHPGRRRQVHTPPVEAQRQRCGVRGHRPAADTRLTGPLIGPLDVRGERQKLVRAEGVVLKAGGSGGP